MILQTILAPMSDTFFCQDCRSLLIWTWRNSGRGLAQCCHKTYVMTPERVRLEIKDA